jgi:molecular chaperone HtpG
MPINIYFNDDSTDSKNAEPINDSNPLWLKEPKDCTKEDYNKFYTKVFNDFNEPLFFIHLNMDYPFKLKGILYFPKLNHELESIEGQVKLYNNQVYVADNIKEVIPEFLLLLKGVLDCPDLPLNVSRSFLQNDGYVNKMSKYISKKVADKLNSIFKNNRKEYNNYWESISIFIKYGAMKEKDFYDRIKKSILFKSIYGELHTLDEFLELTKEKTETKIYYVSDERQQAQYIKLFKDNELDAVLLPHKIDNTFISHIEFYESDKKLQFARIDSEVSNLLKSDDTDIDSQKLIKAFEEALDLPNIKIKSESMKSTDISAIILIDEQSRRMEEMSKLWNNMHIPGMDKSSDNKTLIINAKSDLVHSLMPHIQEDNKDMIKLVCKHIYDLAMLSQNRLDTDGMNSFILRNNLLLQKIIEQSASS